MEVDRIDSTLDVGRDHELAYAKFIPQNDVQKVLLVSSATGVPQEFYWKFATFFAENGFVVYTFDYSGMGRSGGSVQFQRSHVGGVKSWGSIDQTQMTALIRKEYPDHKISLATHSIGGQILGFNPLNHVFDKVLMVASQSASWHTYSGFPLVKILLFFNVFIPLLTPIFRYYPGTKIGIFENLPGSMALEWCKWGKKKEYMMHYFNEQDYYFHQLKASIRSYSFAGDWLASTQGVDWLAKQYQNALVERLHYSAEFKGQQPKHFGFYKEHFKTVFWDSTLKWLLK